MTFDEYAKARGVHRLDYTEPGLHARGHMSDAAKRAAMRELSQRGAQWQEKRDALRAEYHRAVDSGEIAPPTREQVLICRANGHPDRRDTQAARRVLSRRGINWRLNNA